MRFARSRFTVSDAIFSQQSENKDLTTQLAAQTQTRLNLTDKYDATSKVSSRRHHLSRVATRLTLTSSHCSTFATLKTNFQLRETACVLSKISSTPTIARSAVPRTSIAISLLNATRSSSPSINTWTRWSDLQLCVTRAARISMLAANAPSSRSGNQGKPSRNHSPTLACSTTASSLDSRVSTKSRCRSIAAQRRSRASSRIRSRKPSFRLHGTGTTANLHVSLYYRSALKRQQESRLKQLDRFEASIKTATETQRQWRQRVNTKQSEVDSAKVCSHRSFVSVFTDAHVAGWFARRLRLPTCSRKSVHFATRRPRTTPPPPNSQFSLLVLQLQSDVLLRLKRNWRAQKRSSGKRARRSESRRASGRPDYASSRLDYVQPRRRSSGSVKAPRSELRSSAAPSSTFTSSPTPAWIGFLIVSPISSDTSRVRSKVLSDEDSSSTRFCKRRNRIRRRRLRRRGRLERCERMWKISVHFSIFKGVS